MNKPDNTRTVSTTEHSLRIIETLQEQNGARISELTDRVDLSKGTVYQHLATLREYGYVTKEGDEYYLSLRFTNLGEYARSRKPEYIRARELAQELADRTKLDASFVVEENGRGVYLRSETGEVSRPHIHPQVGERLYLHSIAAGKAILAELPESRVDDICDELGLPALNENTITDRATLDAELDRIREQGHAYNRGENETEIRAVAVPVVRSDGTVLGATSVSGPRYRLQGEWFEDELPRQVKEIFDSYEWSDRTYRK
jgi:DNA-binding IclR family transcriptional regulator